MTWEPTLQNPYKGLVVWPVPDNHQVAVTLFKDPRTNELEDKDWSFILEDVSIHFSFTKDSNKLYKLHVTCKNYVIPKSNLTKKVHSLIYESSSESSSEH